MYSGRRVIDLIGTGREIHKTHSHANVDDDDDDEEQTKKKEKEKIISQCDHHIRAISKNNKHHGIGKIITITQDNKFSTRWEERG